MNVLRIFSICAVMLIADAEPAFAQVSGGIAVDPSLDQLPPPQPSTIGPQPVGNTADSAAGPAGTRRTQSSFAGIDPIARLNTRVQNRVQSRLRNRIDRNYDPRANARSPFDAAADEVGNSSRRQRR